MKTTNGEINPYDTCEHCGAILRPGELCICGESKEPSIENGFVIYGRKLEALGKKLQDPNASIDELISACFECGFDINFRILPAGTKRDEL